MVNEPEYLPPHPGASFDPFEVAEKLATELQEDAKRLRGRPRMRVRPQAGDSQVLGFDSVELVPGWMVSGTVICRHDAPMIRELHLRPLADNDDGLTSSAVRRLKFEEIARDARDQILFLEKAATIKERAGFSAAPHIQAAADAVRGASKTQRGRDRLDDGYLRSLAEAYLASEPERRGLYERIASRLGLESSDPATLTRLRNHLNIARKREWLEPTKSGSRQGLPGRLLREARDKEGEADGPTDDLQSREG